MVYLDNAATSLKKPWQVYASLMSNTIFASGNAGRGGHKKSFEAVKKIVDTQDLIAKLFNIDRPQNIVFTQNATYALNTAILGTVRDGGHIIVTEMEHNSVLRPVSLLGNYTVVKADKKGRIETENIIKAIRNDTKLIVCTHASNVCGTVQPVSEIGAVAKKFNIPFLVDAAQTAGCYEVDAEKINADMIAFSGHKGLLGPLGTGGLYIKNPNRIMPIVTGGTGSESESIIQPDFMPDKFHSGTMNTPAIAALGEGVKYILKKGVDTINEQEKELAIFFRSSLLNMDNINVYGYSDIATVAFNINRMSSEEVFEKLKNKVAVRAGYHCAPLAHRALGTEKTGAVRVSFGLYNTRRDAKKMIDYVYSISKNMQG